MGQRPKDADYPRPLTPVDDTPPATVITHTAVVEGKLRVRGTTSDNGPIKRVLVNGLETKPTVMNFAEWEVDLPASTAALTAHAEDAAGNIEMTPHQRTVK